VFADGTTQSTAVSALSGATSIGDLNLVADSDVNGTGNINLVSGNTSRMTILSTGNVGIGTAVPTALFEVAGSLKASSLTVTGSSTLSTTTINGTTSLGGC